MSLARRKFYLRFLSLASGPSIVVEVSPDIHICGVCKQQYNNFEVFLSHKQNGCTLPTPDSSVVTAAAPLAGFKPLCRGFHHLVSASIA